MRYIAIFILGLLTSIVVYVVGNYLTDVAITICNQSENQNKCLRKNLKYLLKIADTKQIMEYLEEKTPEDGKSCHLSGHIVGELSMRNPRELRAVLSNCGSGCDYGCTHGVMAKLFRSQSNIKEIGEMCQTTKHEVFIQDTTACFHGIGHGVAEYANYSVQESMNMCDELEPQIRKEECATGAIMEIMDMNIEGERVLPEINSSLCDNVNSNLIEMCRYSITNRHFIQTRNSELSIQACKLLDEEASSRCYSALGGEAVFVLDNQIAEIWQVCNRSDGGLNPSDCIKGALYSTLVVSKTGELAIELCSFDSKPFETSECLDLLEDKLNEIGSPYKMQICDRLKGEYGYDCQI